MLRAIIAGIISTTLTGAVVASIDVFLGWNVLHCDTLYFLPLGAFAAGAVAGGGLIGVALIQNLKADRSLLALFIAIALLTYPVVYVSEYGILSEDGQLPPGTTLGQYIAFKVTDQPISVSVAGQAVGLGTVGRLGWVSFAFDILAFAMGGFAAYLYLKRWPWCEVCVRYKSRAARKLDYFKEADAFQSHWIALQEMSPEEEHFARLAASTPYPAPLIDVEKSFRITTTVFCCKRCLNQDLRQAVEMYRGKQWQELEELSHEIALPPGVDVAQHHRRASKW